MKPKYVHTKAQHQRKRNPGDDPDLGHVTRMPGGSNRLAIRKRARGNRDNASSRRLDRRRIRQMHARRFAIKLWLSVLLLSCLGALVVGMSLWLRSQADRKAIAPRFTLPDSLPALRLTDFPPPNEQKALSIVRNALAARDEETLRAAVHHSHEVAFAEMLDFFAATPTRDGPLVQHQWIGSTDTEHLQIQSMLLIFRKDGKITQRLAMLVPNESGSWRLDFPSFARWCDPPIQRMEDPAGHPGGRLRVFINRDHYFNGLFSNDREWACFVIASPDTEVTGYAYCPVGSEIENDLDTIIARSGRQTRVTLEVARQEGAQTRQFRITNLIGHDWIAVNPPAEK
ncbi:MAG: hypothetical protein ACNA8L_02580 [Luteolibacter sp.]